MQILTRRFNLLQSSLGKGCGNKLKASSMKSIIVAIFGEYHVWSVVNIDDETRPYYLILMNLQKFFTKLFLPIINTGTSSFSGHNHSATEVDKT